MKLWLIAWALAGGAWATEPQDFVRYQVIVDRSPFGLVTAANMPEAVPSFAQRVQLVGIVTSTGQPILVQAVLYDREATRSWFKAEGEMIDGGVKVALIQDPLTSKAKVVLQYGLERASLTFPERAAGSAATPVPGQPTVNAPGAVPMRPPFPGRIPFRRSN